MRNLYLLLFLCLLAVAGRAQTTYYYQGGTFNSAANWNTAADGSGSAAVVFTGATDTWVVTTTNPLTANAAWSVTGALQVDGTMTISTNPTVTGGITVNAGGLLIQNAASTAAAPNMASVQNATGTVEYSSSTTHTLPGITYGNLTISGTGANTAGAAITVAGTLTVNSGCTLAMSTFQLTAGGSFAAAVSGTLTTANVGATPIPIDQNWGGTVSYLSTSNQTVRRGTYNNLSIGSSGTRTYTAEGALTINGNLNFSLTTTTLADGGFTVTLGGNITGSAGKHSGTGKIVMTGPNATIVGSTNLGNIEFNNAAGFTLLGNTIFNGTTTFTAGALTIGANTMTIGAGGSVVGMSATNCLIGGATSNLTVSATTNIGNVYFDQTTPGTTNTLATLTCSANLGTTTIANPLTITTLAYGAATTAVLADNGNTITILGNITGGGRHSGAGKLLMTGAGATIGGMSQSGNIELDNAAGFSLAGNLSVNGTLTFTNGKLNIGANTLTVATGGGFSGMTGINCLVGGATSNFTVSSTGAVTGVYFDQSVPGTSNNIATFTCSGAAGTTTLASDVTVSTAISLSSATATLNDGGNTITLLGDISGGGKHAGTGKILMTGTNKNIGALANTGNIELDNGGNFNVTGNISCNGTITLTSSTLTLGAITFSILTNGSMSGMSASKYFISGGTANITVNTTGATGTLFFDQTTAGTSNNIATFTNTAGTTTLGNALSVSTALVLTAGTFNDNGNVVTVSGNISGAGTHTGSGKILMTGSGKTIANTAGGLNNLELDNVGGFSLSGTTIVNGTLTFTNGKLSLGTRLLTLKGTVAGMSATNSITGGASSTLTINTAGALGTLFFDQTTPGTSNNIATFTNTTGTTTLGNAVSIGALALTAGTLNDNGNVISLTGNITGTGTHVSSTGGKISLNTAGRSISGVTLGNLDLNYAGATTLTGSPTINGALTFLSTATFTITAGQGITLNGTVSGMSASNYFTGTSTSNLTIGAAGSLGTLYFNQTTPLTTNNIQVLTMTGGGTATLGNNLSAATMTLTSGKLDLNGNLLTLKTAFTGNATGCLVGSGTSTVTVTSTGTTNTLYFDETTPGTTNSLSTLTMNGAAGVTTLGTDVTLGTLALSAGTLADGGNTITVTGNITGTGTHSGAGKIQMTGTSASISGATLGNLDLNYSSGANAFSLSGSATINGTLDFVGANNTLNLASSTLTVKGAVNNMSATKYFTSNGTGSLTVNANSITNTLFFDLTTPGTTNSLVGYTNTDGTTLLGNDLTTGTLTLTAGTLNDNGKIITLTGNIAGTGTHTSGIGGKITMTGLTKSISGATLGNVELNYTSGASAFTLTGNPTFNGELAFTGAANTLTIGSRTITLNGTLTGTSSTKFFTGGAASNIVVGSTGALGTIYMSQTSGTTRTLQTLTISGGGSVTMGNISTVSTTLALTSGTLNDGGVVMTLGGNITGTGTHASTTGGKITMNGATKTISGATLGNLELNNASAFSLTGSPTVNGALTFTNGTLSVGSNTLTLGGTVASMSGTKFITGSATSNIAVTATGALGTLFFDQTTGGTTNNFATFTMNGSGGTATLGNALSAGTLALTAGTLAGGTNAISVTGNITGTGTHTSSGAGVINMTGANATISGATLGSLTLNNASGFSLTGSPTIAGALTLTAGRLDLGSNDLTLSGAGAVAGTPSASNMIVTSGSGQLRKNYSANGSYTFPVGDNTGKYTPVTLNVTSGTYGGGAYVAVNTTNSRHPQNSNTDNYLKRYWTVNTSNITSPIYSLTATYAPTDIQGVESSVSGAKYTGSLPWTKFSTLSSNTLTTPSISNTSVAISGVAGSTPTVTASSDVTICSGGSTNISAISATGSPTLVYTWAPATGLSATNGSSVTASPTVTTTYTLTLTDGNGETATDQVVVTVTTAPSATPANDGYICNGGTVNLTANPAGSTTTYSWAGANLSATTIANPTAAPTANTIYTLTVTDGTANAGCSVDFTTSVDVHAVPTAAPANNGYICNGGTVTLTANPAGGASVYTWSGSSLASSTAQNPTATPTSSTVYTLVVSDGSGRSGCTPVTEYTTAVTVNAAPTAAPTNNGYICNGGSVTLTANPGGSATAYTWTGSNLSSGTAQNPTAAPTSSTVYTLTVSDGSSQPGCAPTTEYTTAVTVNSTPTAAPTNDGYICNGGTVNLSANPAGGATVYTWSGSSLSSGTAQNPSATPTSNTVYTLTVSDGSGKPGCAPATEYTTAVTVNAAPSAAPANDGYICNGGTASLTANPANGANTYTWSGSNLSSTTAQNPTATPNANAVYTLTVSDGSGKSGCAPATEYTTAVTVNSVPAAAPASDGPICVGGTVNLSANPSGGATVYSWSGANLSSTTAQNPTATPTSTTVYTLTVTDGSVHPGCAPTTEYTVSVTVHPVPSLTSASNSGPMCSGNTLNLSANGPSNVTDYSWIGPNSFTSTLQNPSIPSAPVAAAGTYTVTVNNGTGNGCSATYSTTAMISSGPAAITGTLTTCEGNFTVLADATTGGSWISSNSSIATIGSSTGSVQGITAGTATMTYKIGATGCYTTAEVTVNVQPAAITGASALCYAATTTLANAVSGGVWSTSNTTVAPIDATTGVLTGGNPGSATITYSMGSGTGCRSTKAVTVNSLPGLVTGTTLCEGKTVTLTNTNSGGTWSSSDNAIATVGSTTGVVTGVLAGNANITYTLNSTGCYRSGIMTINQSPAAITGNTPVCMGYTITLDNAVTGGTWSVSAGGTIGSATGILTGVSASNPVISYTISNGCRITAPATVNTTPGTFGGNFVVCAGSTINLSNPTSGGAWSSSNTSLATVGTTGVVTGVAGGNPVISYTMPSGCYNTKTITVNAISPILGGTNGVCVGSTITLVDLTPGGVWSSSTTSRATIDASTGVVNGIAAGATNITYLMPSGCRYVLALAVNPISAITGTPMACEGLTTTLADATAGGTWSSTDIAVATVGTSGIVTGQVAGNATISYQMPSGCFATKEVTINQAPVAITGGSTVCAGSVLSLSDAVSGGTWSSSNTAVATVGAATGVVTGVAGGNANITYSNGPGCFVVKAVTVSPILPITGTNSACIGMTTTLSSGSAGGAWSSSDMAVATIGTSGIVSGLTQGTTTVTYTLPSGCARTITVSVNPVPTAIIGTATVCASLTTTLSGDSPGGTWTSSSVAIATVGSTTGVVTGVASGNATITYTMGLNCRVTKVVTVSSSAAITGTAKACIGTSTTLSHSVPGGTWEAANTSIATIGVSDGIATGVASGITTVTYTPPSGCLRTVVVTVNGLPGANAGTHAVCVGSTTVLTNATSGGVSWSSSNSSIASVGSSSGIVTGVAAGTATLTYNVNTGCYATSIVTVNEVPGSITGGSSVCVASTVTLGNATSGGTWTSSNVALATVGSADGIVSGMSAGAPKITYTLSTGCYKITTLTVVANSVNTGTASICVATSATLSNATAGGAWTSSDGSIATVGSATGVVTGVASGNANITYTNPSGCIRVSVATVNNTPANITGTQSVCVGFTTALGNATSGGVWSGSSATVASIGTSGVVTGLTAGTTNISYTLGSCRAVAQVTVNSLPPAITGTTSVCVGSTTTLGNASPGGTWVSSNGTVATVGTSGIVSGVSAGAASITYTATTGCYRAASVVVNPIPSAVTGSLKACPGTTTVVGSATGGGVSWSSSNTAVATVGSTSGIVTGVIAGTSTLTYTVNTGCYVTGEVTINPTPAAITGASDLCPGLTLTLSDADAGGTWSSHYLLVTANDGIVTGVGSGVRAVTYTLPTGCATTTNVTVNPVSDITGNTMVCVGAVKTLANTVTGGTWSSSNVTVATIGSAAGDLTALTAGTSTISYTTTAGCIVTREETVNAVASAGIISGPTTVIAGLQVTLSDDIAGGTWTSSDVTKATIESTTGIVTGVAAGNAVMTYTVNNGCGPVAGTYTVSVTSSRAGGNTVATNTAVDFTVFPNPNKGEFTVKGTLADAKDQDVYVEVANVLGQVIYREHMTAYNGILDQRVALSGTLSSGMYTLKLNLPGEAKVFHFVINQ